MAELKIEVPASADYEEKWADKLPENQRVEIPALDGGREEEREETR